MHIHNPELLDDEEWAENIQILHFIRTQEKEASQS
jgi:hypothetical protein